MTLRAGVTLIAITSLTVILVASCSRPKETADAPTAPTSQPEVRAEEWIPREVMEAPELEDVPQRIVSLAPSHTETLFAIGAGDRVVGVTSYCNYPPEARSLPSVSEFSKINIEKIVALEPDLVLTAHGNPAEETQQLQDLGLPLFGIDPVTYDEVIECIETIGKLVGEEENAVRVANDLRAAKSEVEGRLSLIDGLKQPAVLISTVAMIELPLWVPAQHTFHDDMIRACGARNVVPEGREDWQPVGLETLVASAPTIIVGPSPDDEDLVENGEAFLNRLQRLEGWREMPAVTAERVYVVPEGEFFRPGPRLGSALRRLAQLVHPDLFGEEAVE